MWLENDEHDDARLQIINDRFISPIPPEIEMGWGHGLLYLRAKKKR